MNTKLTLSLDKSVIEAAKDYAKKSGRSLSQIIETHLRKITYQTGAPEPTMAEDLKALYGCIDLPADFDEKKEIRDIILKKHIN